MATECEPHKARPITVRFTSTADFVEELTRDAARVERGIVRLSFRTTYSVPMFSVSMLATAVIAGHVVTLHRYCGSYMFSGSQESRLVGEDAEKQADLIRTAVAELQLEIRQGVYEAA